MEYEQYVFLGLSQDTFFFMHLIKKRIFDSKISNEIYNILLKDSRISDTEQNVIIYEINATTFEFKIIVIQHLLKDKFKTYTLENLSSYYTTLINVPREELFCITFLYEDKKYEIYEMSKISNCDFFRNLEFTTHIELTTRVEFTGITEVFTNFIP